MKNESFGLKRCFLSKTNTDLITCKLIDELLVDLETSKRKPDQWSSIEWDALKYIRLAMQEHKNWIVTMSIFKLIKELEKVTNMDLDFENLKQRLGL